MNECDVLIVGAGPAGLMAAAWMAQTGIKTLLVEKESSLTRTGHADGLEARTLEILDSFGIGKSIWNEANRTIDVCLWSGSDAIQRDHVSSNCEEGWSRFQQATLRQSRIEEHLLSFVKSRGSVDVQWGTVPLSMDMSDPEYIQVQLQKDSEIQSIWTKYMVGCDGAHSWVRRQLNLNLDGETTEENWGVLDCIPVTDFPDVRKRCIIKSDAGNIMIIPRERNLVRLYVQLSSTTAEVFKAYRHTSCLITAIQDILRPYSFSTSHVEWSTTYTAGQRLCPKFAVDNRIFLAGDAVHTHSPKAGQGMNVSMQDTYNLGWKLALVLRNQANPAILQTYKEERLPVAQRLVSFDRRMLTGVGSKMCMDGHSSLKEALSEENTSASGLSVTYSPGLLVTRRDRLCREGVYSKPHLASNVSVGARLASHRVLCQSDSQPWHLQERLQSTGQWHLLVFGGDITNKNQMARVERSGELLSQSKLSSKMATAYLIHSALRTEVEFMQVPAIFRPFDKQNGYDYGRVFADNEECGSAHRYYGIDSCLLLLRPDQHVAYIGDVDDIKSVETFFASFVGI